MLAFQAATLVPLLNPFVGSPQTSSQLASYNARGYNFSRSSAGCCH